MASATSKQVHRITLFKVPDSNNIQPILDKYATMAQDAKKVCICPWSLSSHFLSLVEAFFSFAPMKLT